VQFVLDANLKLKDIWDLDLGRIGEDVEEVADQAVQEAKMERSLKQISEFWVDIKFEFQQHKNTDVMMLKLSEENFETLEENQTNVNGMFSSRYLSTFEEKCVYW
jgi:ATP-dependent protease Clp ATPase subunit